MNDSISRRDVLTRTLPGLALAGAMAGTPLAVMADATAETHAAGPLATAFKDGAYVLPPLPYAYEALEPWIDAQTMHLHHDKHHQGYVNGLNNTLKALAAFNDPATPENAALLAGLEEDLSFNAGGHLLHTLFWRTMAPNAGGEPPQLLADALAREFGSVASFRTRLARVAAGVKGSGWAVLAHEPMADRLLVMQVKQHDMQLAATAVPLLALDVWEHAYYLKYQNVRTDYVKAWWNVVNWPEVEASLVASRGRKTGQA